MALDFLPWIKTGNGNVQNHDSPRVSWEAAGEGIGHHAADVVANEVDILQVQLGDELMDVFGKIGGVIAVGRGSRTANTALINGNDGKLRCETRHDFVEFIPVLGKAVQENDCRAVSASNKMQGSAVYVRVAGGETRAELGNERIGRLSWCGLSPNTAVRGQ